VIVTMCNGFSAIQVITPCPPTMFNPFMSHFPGDQKPKKLSLFAVLCGNIVTCVSCTSVLIIGP